jgi:hypothetical protein
MKKLLAVLPVAMMMTACAPAMYPQQWAPPGYPSRGATYGPSARFQAPALPIGRWDNVMMLATGTSVQVLLRDGGLASGQVIAADSGQLRLRVASGEVDLESREVMRVDRVEGPASVVSDGARGAAFGAGVVGVLGLITGHVPPPRLFAAGAIVGAYNNVEQTADRGVATVYLAYGVAPGSPAAAQWTPRGVPR